MNLLVRSLAVLTAPLAGLLTGAGAAAQGAVVVGEFGAWSLHKSEGAGQKTCFAITQPKEKLPAAANRAAVVFYISAWPKDGVKSEISVKLGYPIKSGSTVTVAVGEEIFNLSPSTERAFVSDATQELKLIEAMRKGSKMVVQATSERGTATTDTYSLAGLSQALQALTAECP
jgi:hypothetical protein